MRPLAGLLALLVWFTLPAGVRAAGLEETLNVHWKGGWVVIHPGVASSCDGYYNDNFMAGDRTESSARRRFEPGEIARVERIDVKRGRLDVFLDLAEGVLEERHDGPFTLYDPRECRIRWQGDCPSLLRATFSPDSGGGKSSDWRRGYEDGQRLAWNLALMRRLKECFVPVPPMPPN